MDNLYIYKNKINVDNNNVIFMKGNKKMKKTITCRPCKEEPNWEIEDQYGVVLDTHYAKKEDCVKEGKKLAKKCGCNLTVTDQKSQN